MHDYKLKERQPVPMASVLFSKHDKVVRGCTRVDFDIQNTCLIKKLLQLMRSNTHINNHFHLIRNYLY